MIQLFGGPLDGLVAEPENSELPEVYKIPQTNRFSQIVVAESIVKRGVELDLQKHKVRQLFLYKRDLGGVYRYVGSEVVAKEKT